MLHTVIFIGRSGCGKGTQAELLKNRILQLDPDKRRILYVETGDRFRTFISGDKFTSRLSQVVYKNDIRQPDFLACWMWGSVLIEELEENMHIIFDGTSRAIDEAQVMTTAMEFYKREQPAVIYLNVSRKWSEKRLLARRRIDDQELSKIGKRLDWFEKDTMPVLEYFRTNSLYRFIEINGEQPIEKVHADIVAAYGNQS